MKRVWIVWDYSDTWHPFIVSLHRTRKGALAAEALEPDVRMVDEKPTTVED